MLNVLITLFVKVCTNCSPQREYVRLFDVTEKTGVRRHKTERHCHVCGELLRDSIVHFGEKGGMESPYNWEAAAEAAQEADVIVCLGSSLKVSSVTENSVSPKRTLFKVLYFILAKFENYTLFILFSVKYFKNTLLYRIALSKKIKSSLFIPFFLKYLIPVSSLSTNEHIQKYLLAPLALT